jgi:hypothetical protein
MTYTATAQAIRKAIEGGWEPQNQNFSIAAISYRVQVIEKVKYKERFFLDLSFWQSLGKELGWNGRWMVQIFTDHDDQSATVDGAPRWKYELHRFIDHLVEGKDAETYFTELLQ